MKRILLILALLPLLFVACSDDDDDASKSGIVGTWVQESAVPKEVITNSEVATKAIKDDIISYNDIKDRFIFSDDGRLTMLDEDGYYEEARYSLSGNKLTVTIPGESNSINIKLSGNTFSADIDETEYYQEIIDYIVSNADDVVVSKVITTYTYKRK